MPPRRQSTKAAEASAEPVATPSKGRGKKTAVTEPEEVEASEKQQIPVESASSAASSTVVDKRPQYYRERPSVEDVRRSLPVPGGALSQAIQDAYFRSCFNASCQVTTFDFPIPLIFCFLASVCQIGRCFQELIHWIHLRKLFSVCCDSEMFVPSAFLSSHHCVFRIHFQTDIFFWISVIGTWYYGYQFVAPYFKK
jgi:hypothetical protein